MESAELIAILREVRDRVRGGNPETAAAPGIALPDLMPLVHARDAALGKVAAIGTVNPRPGGVVHSVVQAWKRLVARVLDWHVREQVEFNRNTVACVDAVLEALADTNRAIERLGSRLEAVEEYARKSTAETTQEVKDIRSHWTEWRAGWECKLQDNEIQFLRAAADLQGSFQHRVTVLDTSYRELLRDQHADFMGAMQRHGGEIQQRLWADLERIRAEYDRMIHSELRIIRQRATTAANAGQALAAANPPGAIHVGQALSAATPPAPGPAGESFDSWRFAERFRGSEQCVKDSQALYDSYFRGRANVLDIGCGRGEFLERMRDLGVPARGIDLGAESVALCRSKGLDVEAADLFDYLAALPEASLDGIFCAQVVEHIAPERLPEMIRLAASRLEPGGVIALETPNPACLAIFATYFYLDPTHHRPVPQDLLAYYLEEAGVGNIEVRSLAPAVESMPSLRSLPEDFRDAFFGGLDYAIIGKKW